MPSSQEKAGIVQALIAAFLFGVSIPIAKHFLDAVPAQWLAGLLYLGSGAGLAIRTCLVRQRLEAPLKRSHLGTTISHRRYQAPILSALR